MPDILNFGDKTEQACGECQACCTVLGIVELGKGMHTRCAHQCTIGCGIYPDRPQSCADFACGWKEGVLVGDFRPDRFGLIFTTADPDCEFTQKTGQIPIAAYEVWEGAEKSPRAQEVLAEIAQRGFLIAVIRGERIGCFYGPPELVLLAARFYKEI